MSIEGMRRAVHFLFAGNLLLGAIFLGSCQTMPQGIHQARIEMAQHIAAEPAGDYFIGRRYYKADFKFWGYIRRPGQPWSAAQLVMLNEKDKLAPDRERLEFGSDNNCCRCRIRGVRDRARVCLFHLTSPTARRSTVGQGDGCNPR